jgi:hypothetical protein
MWALLLLYRGEAAILFAICTLIFVTCRYWLLSGVRSSSSTHNQIDAPHTTLIRIHTSKRNRSGGDNAVYLTRFHTGAWTALVLHIGYGLVVYFADPTSIYYLCISAMLVYEYRDARAATQVAVLLFFALVATLNHVRTTSRLLLQQHTMNHAPTSRLVRQVVHLPQNSHTRLARDTALVDTELAHHELCVGDLVHLTPGSIVPADILLLEGHVLTQELQLTGENIVLNKSCIATFAPDAYEHITIRAQQHASEGIIEWETPPSNLLSSLAYTARNMVFRGTELIDNEAYGVVIEAGNDCAIYRLQHDRHRPPTAIQTRTARVCITNLYLMLLLASCTTLMIYDEREEKAYKSAWIVWGLLRKMLLLFNTLVGGTCAARLQALAHFPLPPRKSIVGCSSSPGYLR